jgi:hypothetical protein
MANKFVMLRVNRIDNAKKYVFLMNPPENKLQRRFKNKPHQFIILFWVFCTIMGIKAMGIK